jgi:hypothetical protein
MILLENFLRLQSARSRRYLYSPSCREGWGFRKPAQPRSYRPGFMKVYYTPLPTGS